MQRLHQQMSFLLEIDKAKGILRRSRILDGSRRENDAEHSWHLAVMALILPEYATEEVDVCRVIKMLLIHDIVEIDAGDTFLYDSKARDAQNEKEKLAASRIFGLLPPEQRDEYIALWQEFEARETAEAKFAAALDRIQPLLANYHTQGGTWREYGIRKNQVVQRTRPAIREASPALWEYVRAIIDDAVAKGYLADDENDMNRE